MKHKTQIEYKREIFIPGKNLISLFKRYATGKYYLARVNITVVLTIK